MVICRYYGLFYNRITWWTMVFISILHMLLTFFEVYSCFLFSLDSRVTDLLDPSRPILSTSSLRLL